MWLYNLVQTIYRFAIFVPNGVFASYAGDVVSKLQGAAQLDPSPLPSRLAHYVALARNFVRLRFLDIVGCNRANMIPMLIPGISTRDILGSL